MPSRYKNFLLKNHLKNTNQRKILFDYIIRQKKHFSIDDVIDAAKKKSPYLGQATVYRMLNTMHRSGEIQEHSFRERTLYEVKNPDEHHDHLICIECDDIVEFNSPDIEDMQDQIAEENGYRLVDHRLDLKGVCSKCQEKKSGKKKK
jgi:Fur family ferric uptake transcriptional regulator